MIIMNHFILSYMYTYFKFITLHCHLMQWWFFIYCERKRFIGNFFLEILYNFQSFQQ